MSDRYEVTHLPEPELCFGYGQCCTHPKDGLLFFGPHDRETQPSEASFGVIGTTAGINLFKKWKTQIESYIPEKDTVPHHTWWPGFEAVFGTRLAWSPSQTIQVSAKRIDDLLRIENRHDSTKKTVEVFSEAILTDLRSEDSSPNLWVVLIPDVVHKYGRPKSFVPVSNRLPYNPYIPPKKQAHRLRAMPVLLPEFKSSTDIYQFDVNFHHQLKARLLDKARAVQIIRESTLESFTQAQENGKRRQVQDPATIAWNLCTALYFKTVGKPWKLASARPGVCYIGLAYKIDGRADDVGNACCGAQMFLDSGDGVVFKGAIGPWYSPVNREFHLSESKAAELMGSVVKTYCEKHNSPPRELFIHSKSRFNSEEWSGFSSVVPNTTKLVGIVIRKSNDLRLYRLGKFPVLRGSAYIESQKLGYLWTTGYTPRLRTYPGWEVPRPLRIEINKGEADLLVTMKDILGLTKINYNTCIFADGLPVTLRFADMVGEILTAAPVEDIPPLPFRYYI